jgi:hypothetical protein
MRNKPPASPKSTPTNRPTAKRDPSAIEPDKFLRRASTIPRTSAERALAFASASSPSTGDHNSTNQLHSQARGPIRVVENCGVALCVREADTVSGAGTDPNQDRQQNRVVHSEGRSPIMLCGGKDAVPPQKTRAASAVAGRAYGVCERERCTLYYSEN